MASSLINSHSESPLVSVIMNCYNCDRFLKDAIDTVYAQSYSNWEIIFWDNASTDKSKTIANGYDSRLKYHYATETTPLGEARNLAMQKAVGKYIAFLDCDDLYMPDKLLQQVELMERGNYVLSYGSAIIIDESGKEKRREPANYESGFIFADLLSRYEINMQSVMVDRLLLEREGLSFPVHFQFGPDYDLFMDIASQFPVGVLKEYIVKTRVLSDSLSRKTLHRVSNELKFTLDRILERDKNIAEKYSGPVKLAYAKLHFYSAVDFISKEKFREARNELKNILLIRWEYAMLYFLLFLPLSSNYILRLLKR